MCDCSPKAGSPPSNLIEGGQNDRVGREASLSGGQGRRRITRPQRYNDSLSEMVAGIFGGLGNSFFSRLFNGLGRVPPLPGEHDAGR